MPETPSGGQGVPAFPWNEAAGFAFGMLRMTPEAFWRSTPRDLALAAAAFRPAGEAPSRSDLAALMARYGEGGGDGSGLGDHEERSR